MTVFKWTVLIVNTALFKRKSFEKFIYELSERSLKCQALYFYVWDEKPIRALGMEELIETK